MQNVGFAACARQSREQKHGGARGLVRVGRAVIIVKPIQRDLASIWCSNELTAGHTEQLNLARGTFSETVELCVNTSLSAHK